MGWIASNAELLRDLARHQVWADNAHWKALHENSALFEDLEIRNRLNHMVMALRMLTPWPKATTPDPSRMKDIEPADQLEAALGKANAQLIEALDTIDLANNDRSAASVRTARGKRPPECYCCRRSRTVNITVVRTHQE